MIRNNTDHRRSKHYIVLLVLSSICILCSGIFGRFYPAAYAKAAGDSEIISETVDEASLSVDPTNKEGGWTAVLYDNTNGLPTSEANAIAETSDGFIWIGSYAGLIRYDGNTFERIDSETGLSSIKCLLVDSKDRLWIGTNDNGVAVMEPGNLRMWGKLDGMRSAHIRAITEDHNGTIYVATTRGIVTIDPEFNLATMDDELIADANMRDLQIAEDGTIYGTTDLGDILVIRDGKLSSYLSIEDNPLHGVGAIMPDPDDPGKIYAEATDLNLYRIDADDNFKFLEQIDIKPLIYLKQLKYIDGKIFVCGVNGIGILENGKFHLLDDLPMNNNVAQVMTDYLGNLWFASTRQGVMKIVPNQFLDVFERYGLPEVVVNSTCMSDGKLFVGTDTGLIVLDDDKVLSKFPIKKAVTASGNAVEAEDLIGLLKESRIRSIIRDSRDRLWISTWRSIGLLCYDRGKVTVYTEEDGLLSTSIRSVYETGDDRYLVAVTGGVNVIKDDRIVASYSDKDGITNTESLTVCEGFNGEIVLGSNGDGIYVFDDNGMKNVNVEDGLPSDIVMCLKKDAERNVIWIITGSAIAYMTPDYKVTTIKKFPYTNNFDMYENSNGYMWVLSSNGIYVVPADELIANEEINPVFYGIANGLSCITTANSYSELTPDGDLYIAGSTGVCKVNIEKPMENVDNLKATVPYVEVDGERVYANEDGAFTVGSDMHKLTIPGFVFNYALSDPKVTYKLEGFDRKSTTVDRSDLIPAEYTNLNGGTYRFVMKVSDSMGKGSKELSIKIVKTKAFYEQIWFYILIMLLAFLLIAGCVRIYLRIKTRVFEKKEEENRLLIREITEAFAKTVDMKDKYTNGHSSRVAEYTVMLAKEMGLDSDTIEKYYNIALLHDIGKIGIPAEVLNKPGKLTDEEYQLIKSHTTLGYDTLKGIHIMPELATGAGAHHERPDGKGYPNGLKEGEIPQVAQIIAVADTFDAMYSNRPYRERMNFEKVVSIIKDVSGSQLHKDVVDAFLRLVEKGEFRAPDDDGGGSMEDINNIRARSLEGQDRM